MGRLPQSTFGVKCLLQMAEGLSAGQDDIPMDGEDSSVTLSALIERCIQDAGRTVLSDKKCGRSLAFGADAALVLETCLKLHILKPYETLSCSLLQLISESPDDALDRESCENKAFLAGLWATLLRHAESPSLQPFRSIIEGWLRVYLTRYLGSRPPGTSSRTLPAAMPGCGSTICDLCKRLRSFFTGSRCRNPVLEYVEAKRRREHVQTQLMKYGLNDLCTTKVEMGGGSVPNTLVIKKKPGIAEIAEWGRRVEVIRGMLNVMGDAQHQGMGL
jgi:hypothetical protein